MPTFLDARLMAICNDASALAATLPVPKNGRRELDCCCCCCRRRRAVDFWSEFHWEIRRSAAAPCAPP
eukprot:SAG25_NODE_7849_length_454_cov_1.005634_1_plen_67_part_10